MHSSEFHVGPNRAIRGRAQRTLYTLRGMAYREIQGFYPQNLAPVVGAQGIRFRYTAWLERTCCGRYGRTSVEPPCDREATKHEPEPPPS
jgi:hypothetical protein